MMMQIYFGLLVLNIFALDQNGDDFCYNSNYRIFDQSSE